MNRKSNIQIWSHHLVRNEERWVWYSVMSVVDYVDKVMLWDMESGDGTLRICQAIKEKYPQKVSLKRIPKVDPAGFAKVRQAMLDATVGDWFLVVDGDEIWWEESIKILTDTLRQNKNSKMESAVVPVINVVGDIFHYQEESAGKYTLAGRTGHFGLRAVNRKIPGLSSSKPHGTWGWTDGQGKMIQDRDEKKIIFVDSPYIHTTHLPRGASRSFDKQVVKRTKKLKYEIGFSFPKDFFYPEVFFRARPDFVPSPWFRMSDKFKSRAYFETPLRQIKRRLFKGKTGY